MSKLWEMEGTVTLIQKEVVEQLIVPKRYQVILHNDDYTPMGFVVTVLKQFFFFNAEEATALMWDVHMNGKALCGVFTRDIAETKVLLVSNYAKQHEYPLLCTMEKVNP